MRRRRLIAAVLLSPFVMFLVGCDRFDGEVVLVNPETEPRLYHTTFGLSAPNGGAVDPQSLVRIDPGERVILGKAEALADSGGVTVTVFAIPNGSGSEPEIERVDAVGGRFLRDTIGDTVLGEGAGP